MPCFRYGSTIADNPISICCKYHGKLSVRDLNQIRHEFIIDEKPPPSSFDPKTFRKHQIVLVQGISVLRKPKLDPVYEVKTEKIISKIKCPSCDLENSKDMMIGSLCKYCFEKTTSQYKWDQKQKEFNENIKFYENLKNGG